MTDTSHKLQATNHKPQTTRRQLLVQAANGFGAMALAALMQEQAFRAATVKPERQPHFPAKARSVIFLFMDGGPSQVDTSTRNRGSTARTASRSRWRSQPTQFDNVGTTLPVALGVPAPRAERHPGQRPVSPRRRLRRRPASSARWSPNSRSTPTRTTSCTPAAGCRAGRAWAPGRPTAWAASARICPASSSCTAG